MRQRDCAAYQIASFHREPCDDSATSTDGARRRSSNDREGKPFIPVWHGTLGIMMRTHH